MADDAHKGAASSSADRIDILDRRHHPAAGLGLADEHYDRLVAETTGLPPGRGLQPGRAARGRPARERRRHRQRARAVREASASSGSTTCRTAYVAGTRTGMVYEHELTLGQQLQEPLRVDQVPGRGLGARGDGQGARRRSTARPSWSATHRRVRPRSSTGPTTSCARSPASVRAPLPHFGRSDAPFNVVPVDFILDSTAAAAGDEAAVGETLHLVDPEPGDRRGAVRAARARVRRQEPKMRLPAKAGLGLAAHQGRARGVRRGPARVDHST